MRGSIILVRHGQPALSRAVILSAAGYREWWARYEVGGLLPGQSPPADLTQLAASVAVIVASTRRRAVESAELAAAGRPILTDSIFVEAPLPPPPLPDFIQLSPRLWGFFTRFCWWYLDLHSGEESRRQAEARAGLAADRLITLAEKDGVVLFAHGFFNTMIARELRHRGFRYAENQGWKYWTRKRFEAPVRLEHGRGVLAAKSMG